MRFFRIRNGLLLTMIFISASAGSGPQKALDKNRLRVADFSGIELGAVLATIATDYSVTIGFEADPNNPRSPIEVRLRDVNFLQLIDGLVKADRRYEWGDQNGFIQVLPAQHGPSLLNQPIARFQVKDVSRELALNSLFGLPEVQTQAASLGLKVRTPADAARDEKLSFDLSGVTVRQVLNQIADQSGARFWIARKFSDGVYEIKLSCC